MKQTAQAMPGISWKLNMITQSCAGKNEFHAQSCCGLAELHNLAILRKLPFGTMATMAISQRATKKSGKGMLGGNSSPV